MQTGEECPDVQRVTRRFHDLAAGAVCAGGPAMPPPDIADRALRFAVRIVRVYERITASAGAARVLAPQLLRSAASIGANLEEATAGQTKPDFIAKVSVARKEARETVYWLRLIAAAGLVQADAVEWEISEARQLVAILGTIVLNAKTNSRRGT